MLLATDDVRFIVSLLVVALIGAMLIFKLGVDVEVVVDVVNADVAVDTEFIVASRDEITRNEWILGLFDCETSKNGNFEVSTKKIRAGCWNSYLLCYYQTTAMMVIHSPSL